MITATNTNCRYCQTPDPTSELVCRTCWYSGRVYADVHAELLEHLRSLPGVTRARPVHTGGNCWGIEVASPTWYAFLTEGYVESSGELMADATLSDDPNGLFAIGLYGSEDAFYGEELGHEDPIGEAWAAGPRAVRTSLESLIAQQS